MNLLLWAVWCGFLLACTVSLPRKRQIRYPVTRFQNSHYERSHPTALEVLERTLLRPHDKRGKHPHLRSERRRSASRYGDTTPPLSPLQAPEHIDTDSIIDSCVASFGDQSPLCKPRRREKKSYIGIPDIIHKRLFRSDTQVTGNMTLTTNTPEDFFGVFKTTNAPFTSSVAVTSAASSTGVATTKVIPTNVSVTNASLSGNVTAEESIPVTKNVITRESSPKVPVSLDLSESNDDEHTSQRYVILPGIVKKIESEPESLYLEEPVNSDIINKQKQHKASLKGSESDTNEEESQISPTTNEPTTIVTENDHSSTENDHSSTANELTPMKNDLIQTTNDLTSHPMPPTPKTSLLTGDVYSKDKCEEDNTKRCICSFSSVDTDFHTIFSKAKNADEIMSQIAYIKCRQYAPIPTTLTLNSNAKPRVLKGKHSPFPIDNEKGAKEVTEKSIDEFIAYSAVDDGITRVFVSSDVKIPCFPKPDIHLSASDADHVQYVWTYGNKKQTITQGRLTEDADGDGSLLIEEIELTDSMNYTCEIDYTHPDTGERTTDAFVHTLSVVTLPIVSARTLVHYTSSSAACDESLLEVFEMYLPQQLEQALCSPGDRPQLCSVVVHSPVCHSGTKQEKSKREANETDSNSTNATSLERRKREQTAMEMSLNYDVYVHRTATKALPGDKGSLCDPDCHLLVNFKLLQLLREGAQELALVPILSEVQGGGTFTPEANSVKVKYIFGCIGGYYLDNGFCLACPVGTYSDDGATECTNCPMHTFSAKLGARVCTPCKYVWMPVCNEYFETMNIRFIIVVVCGVVLVLVLFISYYIFFYKGQTWKDVIKKGPKEKIAKSERIKSRKEAKREVETKKKAAKESKKGGKNVPKSKVQELKRLLESSGESDFEPEYTTPKSGKSEQSQGSLPP